MNRNLACAVGLALSVVAAGTSAWAQGPDRPRGGDREGPGGPGGPGGFGGPGRPGGPGGRGERHFGPGGGPPEGAMFSMPVPPPAEPLTGEQQDQALAFLKENDPVRAERLSRLREDRPEMFERFIREAWEQMRHLSRLKEADPDEFARVTKIQKMERAAGELAEKIRKTEAEDERQKMTAQLREQLATLFDQRETGREREVKELERRLADLRRMLSERKERKDEIIQRRVDQMLGRGEVMEW